MHCQGDVRVSPRGANVRSFHPRRRRFVRQNGAHAPKWGQMSPVSDVRRSLTADAPPGTPLLESKLSPSDSRIEDPCPTSSHLPLLSVPDLVVLPGMVVPIELDGDARAGRSTPPRPAPTSRLLLAPRLSDRYPTHGVIATIEQVGRLPGGEPRRRAARRRARPDRLRRHRPRRGPVGRGRDRSTTGRVTDHVRELAAEYKRARRRDPAAAQRLAGHRHRAADHRPVRSWPTRPATRRTSTDEQKRELLETPDVDARLDAGARVGARAPRRARGHREDPRRRPRGHGQEPARVPAAPAARRDPQGARRGRARGRRRLPHPRRGRRPAREGPRGRAARGRQARARQRPEPRGRLDPHLARHRARAAVERRAPTTTPTSPAPARSSTPTTTASTT